jgi:DNA-binding LacI/PurR family transcriptional regulator
MVNQKSPTIRDIAQIAGVTPGTVSRALNDSPLVNEKTKGRIVEIAKEINYSPNLVARRLSIGKTFAIGVIVPFFTRPSVSERLDGVVSVLSNSNYDLVIHDIENPHQRTIGFQNMLHERRIDGALIISMPIIDEDVQFFRESPIPIVFVDRKDPSLSEFNSIVIDDVNGGYQATRHLIDLGHTKIGFIGDNTELRTNPLNEMDANPFRFTSSRDRYKGYQKAMAEADIPINPDYYGEDEHGHIQAWNLALEMLQLPDPPTAIFAASDTQAFGVIQAARQLNIPIPEKLSVVGFDDIQAAEFMQLTTIRQLLYESGCSGVELLINAINGKQEEPVTITLPTELVIRNTTSELSA